tara:strand:+ start:1374 stop:1838 length:465 start_codon:yes stop_codon:yes gene_type:complete
VPKKKAKKEPKAIDRLLSNVFDFDFLNSILKSNKEPIKPPIIGPKKSAINVNEKNIETKNPILTPQIAFFEPPIFLTPKICKKKSEKVAIKAKNKTTKIETIGLSKKKRVPKCRYKKPIKVIMGPGKIGKKEPRIPKENIKKTNPISKNNIKQI